MNKGGTPENLKPFDSKRAKAAGKKSKRKPLDQQLIEEAGPEGEKAIRQALIKLAKKGNMTAIREYYDRIIGKPKQTIEQKTELTTESPMKKAIEKLIDGSEPKAS